MSQGFAGEFQREPELAAPEKTPVVPLGEFLGENPRTARYSLRHRALG